MPLPSRLPLAPLAAGPRFVGGLCAEADGLP